MIVKSLGLLLAAAASATSQPTSTSSQTTADIAGLPVSRGPLTVEIDVRHSLAHARAGGKDYIVYELHITNFVPTHTMTLHGIDVKDAAAGQTLASLDKNQLSPNIRHVGPKPEIPPKIAPGQRVLVFLWVPLKGAKVPSIVKHEVRLTLDGINRLYVIESEPETVVRTPLIVIASPLAGSGWLAANGPQPADVPAHNQLLYPSSGRIKVPQRFATDWVKLSENGRMFAKNGRSNEDYAGFGEPVLAVADGTVVEVLNDVHDNKPPEHDPQQANHERSGNYVILQIAPQVYAFYGHLKQGSVVVKAGQKVFRGQVLGRLGNSGNSTGPHLHFHLTDEGAKGSEGVPFTFSNYVELDRLGITLEQLDEGAAFKHRRTGSTRSGDLPLGQTIVAFPPAQR